MILFETAAAFHGAGSGGAAFPAEDDELPPRMDWAGAVGWSRASETTSARASFMRGAQGYARSGGKLASASRLKRKAAFRVSEGRRIRWGFELSMFVARDSYLPRKNETPQLLPELRRGYE